jgi:proteasome lid subunit RPN8/RPN11
MLIITPRLIEAMIAQARKEHPLEICGIIAGAEGCVCALWVYTPRLSTT